MHCPSNGLSIMTILSSFLRCLILKIFSSFLLYGSELDIGGEMNIAAGIQVAQLALKHRQNKNQRQRIIVFAGRYALLALLLACSCLLTFDFPFCPVFAVLLSMIGR